MKGEEGWRVVVVVVIVVPPIRLRQVVLGGGHQQDPSRTPRAPPLCPGVLAFRGIGHGADY
ncbi:hypothetical protein E2C01_066017 [Portunus trituberculatus]|uniref:Uncharacterized protein n=1 Tax=Portunus trituberculatus TaxID=210409 RepID=A0A5B7HG36_PORTR|nr:hypothetical protein [Portunus trituberculatus]